ncbi:glycosyltransferase family A protein [uncultured Formosa sp.]|uniref:glycosyltransferase family 2 protein n=1 Tax=uncultured Formosa sp. TaxID=255435 RepID=UPI0026246BDB|nr:glycosyltransferase family A protein [uncultured Formosa sp.]
MTKVSIVVPVYNRADVILDTVNSIINQSYTDWELLLIDDGSTDETRKVLAEIDNSELRILNFNREAFRKEKGAPVCRNIGLEKASGEYVMFLDSDDLLSPSCLNDRVAKLKEFPETDFLVFSGAFFAKNINDSDRLWNRFTEENDLGRFLRGDVVWQTTGPIWKRNFLLDNQHKFDEEANSSQDWEFHINILLEKPNYFKIEGKPDYFVRRDEDDSGRISGGHNSYEKYKNRIDLILKLLNSISSKNELNALHKYLVRDTISCLRKEASKDVLDLFLLVNKQFPKNIKKYWPIFIKLSYWSFNVKSDIAYRIIAKLIDFAYPGYFKGFKMSYRSKY